MKSLSHCFALHSQQRLTHGEVGEVVKIHDQDLCTRITRVLRLRSGENVILFDDIQSQLLQLELPTFQNKKTITATLRQFNFHKPLEPRINLCIGLLKKEALEEVAYYAAAMGATHLIPVFTGKVQRSWGNDKEKERLKKVMIAACEQSKQFILPLIESPVTFDQFLKSHAFSEQNQSSIYFDVHGKPLLEQLNNHEGKLLKTITLFWGPEGGLLPQEVTALDQHGFLCAVLTPTVLRAVDAVAVGLGSFASCLRS